MTSHSDGQTFSEQADGPPRDAIYNSYAAYGCRVNALDPEDIFRRYEEAGFVYPAKMERLRPFLTVIKDQWRRALRAGELILRVVTFELHQSEDFATVSSWLTTNRGRMNQHLASTGQPLGSRAALLAATGMSFHDGVDRSHQIWSRPDNKYARRLFGGIDESLGAQVASVNTWDYIGIPLQACSRTPARCLVTEANLMDVPSLCQLAGMARGSLYSVAEELDSDDLQLQVADDIYRRVGLRRYRRVFLLRDRAQDALRAAAIVYRGPLGMNFSYLENRCDLLISDEVTDDQLADIVVTLLARVGAEYLDFLPAFVPITTDRRTSKMLLSLGGRTLAKYSSSVWLQEAVPQFHRHVEKVYERITNHRQRALRPIGDLVADAGGSVGSAGSRIDLDLQNSCT